MLWIIIGIDILVIGLDVRVIWIKIGLLMLLVWVKLLLMHLLRIAIRGRLLLISIRGLLHERADNWTVWILK